jgi:hypothetical protein
VPHATDDQQPQDRLIALCSAAERLDPMPHPVIAAGRAAWAWRRIDAELAELTYDSLLDDASLAGVCGVATGPRLVSFEAGDVTIEVEVASDRDHRRLVGQIVPPQCVSLTVRRLEGTSAVETDDLGRFHTEVSAGPMSLRCELTLDRAIETEWLVL